MIRSAKRKRCRKRPQSAACFWISAGCCSPRSGIIKSASGRGWNTIWNWPSWRDRHYLTFDTYEEGKLKLEEYLGRVVFQQERPFTRAQFRRFMFAQSQPYPEMIELIARLESGTGWKIAVVSNEARELNAHRIRNSSWTRLWTFIFSCFVQVCKPDAAFFGLRWTSPRCQPGRSSISKIPPYSSRSRKDWGFEAFFTRITGDLRPTSFVGIAE